VLFAAAEGARTVLPDELGADVVSLYRTRELRPTEFPAVDLVILTSASSARALAALTRDLPVVSIGPETSRAAGEAGLRIVAEALPHSSEGLALAVAGLSEPDRATGGTS